MGKRKKKTKLNFKVTERLKGKTWERVRGGREMGRKVKEEHQDDNDTY